MIRNALEHDSPTIATLYNHYIEHTVITFETEPVTANDMQARLDKAREHGLPFLVAEVDNQLIGYAYASRWHPRAAAKRTVEVSIYLAAELKTQGWGTRLFAALLSALEDTDTRAIVAGITEPNPPSQALMKKFGLSKIGVFPDVAEKLDQTCSVGYWHKALKAAPATV